MGSYNCRTVANSKIMSEHSYGTAIDISHIDDASVKVDWNENTINARPIMDSLGNMIGYTIFNENGRSFKAKEMTYNYKTKKSFIKKISTKEGEGYIHGRKVKKTEEEF